MLSGPLGTGIYFAAAMCGAANPKQLDIILDSMNKSYFYHSEELINNYYQSQGLDYIHACTDVTGFGLLGHLSEMITITNYERIANGLTPVKINLEIDSIPYFKGVFELIQKGYISTLAPANRRSIQLLDSTQNNPNRIYISRDKKKFDNNLNSFLELIIDPQTCGPLLISCKEEVALELILSGNWFKIGSVIH